MRKITELSKNAFYTKGKLNKQNMSVSYSKSQDTSYMSLHGNTIAIYSYFNKTLQISSCGWFTPTTKERLNALNGVNIQQKNFIWFLNGKEWDGELITIKN